MVNFNHYSSPTINLTHSVRPIPQSPDHEVAYALGSTASLCSLLQTCQPQLLEIHMRLNNSSIPRPSSAAHLLLILNPKPCPASGSTQDSPGGHSVSTKTALGHKQGGFSRWTCTQAADPPVAQHSVLTCIRGASSHVFSQIQCRWHDTDLLEQKLSARYSIIRHNDDLQVLPFSARYNMVWHNAELQEQRLSARCNAV
jgi:hypothetical protein